MSWEIFKRNVLRVMNRPESIKDIDTVAKTFAREYDLAVRRGGDTINKVSIKKGNTEIMEQLFIAALFKGLNSTEPYDLVGEMGKGVLAYWGGAIMNEAPIPIIPAIGSVVNIGVVSNVVTNPGQWAPVITVPPQIEIEPEIPTSELLRTIPDDNNTVEAARTAVSQTGVEFINDAGDDPGPQLQQIKNSMVTDRPKFNEVSEESAISESIDDVNRNEIKQTLCGAAIDYDSKLSPSFRLRDVSIGCTFPHKIKAQRNLNDEDIICNLQNLAVNILEPLKAQYPNMIINSGFRGTPSLAGKVSQHEKGEAVDVQFKNITPLQYLDIAKWVKSNLPFDQLIFEHGNSIWLHISCKKSNKQRKQILTMYKGKYKNELKCYYT